MDLEQINARIRAKQELLNIEQNQDKKNEILHQISVLNMRKEIANTKEKIKKMTD
ncbi:hypothetical protein [Yeosuana marina]|mgnify:CR=1 FL=1|uniref:hypothetical protein n=1 Tax=Yeosuana marina TaxID=1565536 RepID=UPI0030EF2FD4|tara:strand:+ start:774 stop:938 length:165 start_codon:yes stop_codon:yes gene_type:complete